ncbi:DnaJ domain containing protein [Theileria equi strain WA]|uniref:DnaJ domain containing protein n=1 Tax=Theileria equi strain WA TaxID=1537102 RepID=L0AXJ0_THEEQ|nr:DnaJ domain containing protein [Theileria equi strain WA]AFZ80285.1 DnaJ domain containing protein [Theileria equi strain WA]|eukprot:XP_004829951.1 DnaJ domain containing protein [Theileria equi strain WA]
MPKGQPFGSFFRVIPLFKRSFSTHEGIKPKSGRTTHYDVLNVPRDASKRAIKQAYLKLVKEHHPDSSKNKDGSETFITIKEAYEVLKDSKKRNLYDIELKRNEAHDKSPLGRATGVGWIPSSGSTGYSSERFERYKRYTSGIRNDVEDDPYDGIKTVASLAIAAATILLFCLIGGELIMLRPDEKIDEDEYAEEDVEHERMVISYYNPVNEEWERIIEPYEAPPPQMLAEHYREKTGELPDLGAIKTKLTVLEMPISSTVAPTLLYDRNKRKIIAIEKR